MYKLKKVIYSFEKIKSKSYVQLEKIKSKKKKLAMYNSKNKKLKNDYVQLQMKVFQFHT